MISFKISIKNKKRKLFLGSKELILIISNLPKYKLKISMENKT